MLFHAWLLFIWSFALVTRSLMVGRGLSSMIFAMSVPGRSLQPHAVGVAVVVGAHVRVAGPRCRTHLAEDDDPGRTAVDAQRAPRADVVVDDEQDLVARVVAGHLGPRR